MENEPTMDDTTLSSLRAALAATPDNHELRTVLLRAHLERGEAGEARALLDDVDPTTPTNAEHRELAGRALLAMGDAARALDFVGEHRSDDDAKLQLARARVLLALDRRREARLLPRRREAKPGARRSRPAQRSRRECARVSEPRGCRERAARPARDFQRRHRRLGDGAPAHARRGPGELRRRGWLDQIKNQIRKRIILPFQKPSLFQRFKKRVGGGILLYGPPGCGKTLLARATAGECDATFFNVAIADILDMYIGESERKLHAIFEKARESTPAVLFFDEIEALGGKRQYTREATSSKLVSNFSPKWTASPRTTRAC